MVLMRACHRELQGLQKLMSEQEIHLEVAQEHQLRCDEHKHLSLEDQLQ
jgi:hypothetical protein